jgi:hypothetical protein
VKCEIVKEIRDFFYTRIVFLLLANTLAPRKIYYLITEVRWHFPAAFITAAPGDLVVIVEVPNSKQCELFE